MTADTSSLARLEQEDQASAIEQVLVDYLRAYSPATTPPLIDGAFVRTSDDIIADLDEMVAIDKNTVAKVMLEQGYTTALQFPRRFGWLMKKAQH